MKNIFQNKVFRIIMSVVATTVLVLAVFWLWLRFTIPDFVTLQYAEAASDTHLQAKLSYCVGAENYSYTVIAKYAAENTVPGGVAGWVSLLTEEDLTKDELGDAIGYDLAQNGDWYQWGDLFTDDGRYVADTEPVEQQHSFCVPLKAELKPAVP